MAKKSKEFDIGTAEELQQRNGWYAENWEPPHVDPANVPDGLRHLIPFAKRWGITCDVTRRDAEIKASQNDLAELRDQLHGSHALYEDWAYGGLNDFTPNCIERSVFGAMYSFEFEACHGPGINMKLNWAISRFQDSPDEINRDLLQSALESVIARGRTFIKPRQESVDIAKNLLHPPIK